MKRLTKLALMTIAAAIAVAPITFAQSGNNAVYGGKDKEQLRTLNGRVADKGDQPISGSVVYLKNTKTLTVKSAYTDEKGEFHFHALSPNVDYEVYAEFNGTRSQTKTMSSFDSRAVVNMDLKIDVAK
jgi:hypothetical protein